MLDQIILKQEDYDILGVNDWVTFSKMKTHEDNLYYFARKKINIPECPQNAIIHVCAQSSYLFYLNGKLLGQGPVKASDLTCYYDSYDISNELKPGINYFAMEIHHPGNHFRTCSPGIPAFWCQLPALANWRNDDWQVCFDPSRLANSTEFTFQMGYNNSRDMRKIPVDWQVFGENCLDWHAGILADNPNKNNLKPRDIPALTRDFIRPVKLVDCGSVPEVPGEAHEQDFAAIISNETHNSDETVFDWSSRIIKSFPNGEGVYLIYDFQREVYGNIVIRVDAPAGAILDMTYGEMLEDGRIEACYPFKDWKPKAKTNADAYRFADRHILAEGENNIEIRFQKRGCRYIQIIFRKHLKPIVIKEFGVENRVYPVGNEGYFNSDNKYYNELWDMCKHTVQHCVDDSFIDCPWREQAFWINDFLVSNLYYFNLTADPKLPRHCFDLAVDGFKQHGFMPAVYPAGDPLLFPSMAALWTLTLYEYYLYSGDEKGKQELLPAMDAILATYDKLALPDGLVPNHKTWWNFIDIGYADAGIELKGCTSILNSLIAAAYKCAASMHEGNMAEKYSKLAQEICAAMKKELWDVGNKRFRDSTEKGFGFETFSVHPHAVLLLFDLMPEYNEMLAEALISHEAIAAEPYFQRFVLEAMAKIGRHDLAEHCIEHLWSKMVNADFPTIWEIALKGPKRRGVAQSLCHAFSCAPLAYFSRTIAGIVPLEPGFSKFTINPESYHIKNFECHQPTPHGTIRVKRNDNEIDIFVPPGTSAILPDGNRREHGLFRFSL